MMFRNARTRLILASVLLNLSVAALLLGIVYFSVNSIIETETQSVVEAELEGLADSYRRNGVPGLAAAIERRISSSDRRDSIYLLADARGQAIAGNLGAWPPTVQPGGGWVELELIRTDTEKTVPVSAASLRLLGGERLLVGRDASARKLFDSALFRSGFWALMAAVALSIVTGWLLTRLIFGPLSNISRTAKTIVSGDLSQRIPLRGTEDELERLSTTLNEMLDRISDLVENLKLSTSSLSHDLRSPLTRLRARLEKLSQEIDGDSSQSQSVSAAMDEVDLLLKTFHNLTEIARAEAGLSQNDFDLVDLSTLITDAVDLYAPVAHAGKVELIVDSEPVVLHGHRHLLMQALSNLLENALRFTPEGSVITVACSSTGGGAQLSVTDQGPGLPEAFLSEAAKPFTTQESSRSDGGTGLGLALVSAVARLHGGDISLQNQATGLRVELRLRSDRGSTTESPQI